MDEYKKILINLIQKCKDTLTKNPEYVSSVKLLKKINKAIINDNPQNLKIDYDKIISLSSEEISLFTSPVCERIISSLPYAIQKRGVTTVTILKNIKMLEEDLINNKIKSHTLKIKRFDVLLNDIENITSKNYKKILDFIEFSFNSKSIDDKTAMDLNFYVLRKYNSLSLNTVKENKVEIIKLIENRSEVDDIRKQLEQSFSKYGYNYDVVELDKYIGEENFVKYAKTGYVDYVLSKFYKYGVTQKDLYNKKTFYNIVIDNDKKTFNSIIEFVDENGCSLSKLLYFPSIFSKKVREYVFNEKNIKIFGCNLDFLKNIELYKKLKSVDKISDSIIDELGIYLCTSNELISKNMEILLKYNVVSLDKFPDTAISLCGNNVEYFIDRFIETSIYEEKLLQNNTSLLFSLTKLLAFYKIKRAIDMGESLFNEKDSLRKVFVNDSVEHLGISLSDDFETIIQKEIPMEDFDNIDVSKKKYLPNKFFPDDNISWEDSYKIIYKNLYEYRTYKPTELFVVDKIKANLIEKIFERDYSNVVLNDDCFVNSFIHLLDEIVYCDFDGNTKPLKNSNLQYVFMHSSFPNMYLIISRCKVLRLCKLLYDNNCFINERTSLLEKEDILLSILLKDTIVSEYEVVMLRTIVRDILTIGLIKVDSVDKICLESSVIK